MHLLVLMLQMQRKANEVSPMKRAGFFLVIFLIFGVKTVLATPIAELADPNNLILIGTGVVSLLIIARR